MEKHKESIGENCQNGILNAKTSGTQTPNVPALRFPEFTGEWKRHKLSEVCSFYSGGTPSSSKKEYYNGNIPFIRSGELHKDYTELFITEAGLSNSAAKLVETGDLLLALYGATSGDIAISKIKGAINQAILCIRTKQNKKFIESVWNKHVERLLQTYLQGGQGNLSADIVKNIPFYFANSEEQDKLAKFISLLDERIATQNRIIEKLQSLIKGIRNNMMIPNHGDCIALQDIADIYQPKTIPSTDLTEDGYLVYGANGIIGKYHLYNHEKEQICITCRGNTCGTVNYTEPKSWITGNAMVINTDNFAKNVNKRYLFHYLSFINFNSIISGSGQPQIVRQPLAKLKLILPELTTQEYIAKCLDTILAKIKNEQTFLQAIQIQKSYLLSQIFI